MFAADRRLKGQAVTIGEALHESAARAHVLLPWAVVSATVSIVLRAIEQRGGILGRIVGAIAGVAWSVVTFLVLPVLVFEGIGPIAAVKRSGELFKQTWGENLIANAGIGLVALRRDHRRRDSAASCSIMVGGPGRGGRHRRCSSLWVIAVQLVASTLTGILQTALYRFATGGEVARLRQRAAAGRVPRRAATRPRLGSTRSTLAPPAAARTIHAVGSRPVRAR